MFGLPCRKFISIRVQSFSKPLPRSHLLAIEASHLRRTFTSNIGVIKRTVKEIVAVDDVSFEIKEGELFGLLGPNGAGKTSTTWWEALYEPACPGQILADGVTLADILPLPLGELGIGILYGVLGNLLFAVFEIVAKRRGTLEVF